MAVAFKRLDVRPFIAQGDEPFSAILARAYSLKEDEGLTIIAPFLPSPLIEKLKSEGFHATVAHQPDGTWTANFWRDR